MFFLNIFLVLFYVLLVLDWKMAMSIFVMVMLVRRLLSIFVFSWFFKFISLGVRLIMIGVSMASRLGCIILWIEVVVEIFIYLLYFVLLLVVLKVF